MEQILLNTLTKVVPTTHSLIITTHPQGTTTCGQAIRNQLAKDKLDFTILEVQDQQFQKHKAAVTLQTQYSNGTRKKETLFRGEWNGFISQYIAEILKNQTKPISRKAFQPYSLHLQPYLNCSSPLKTHRNKPIHQIQYTHSRSPKSTQRNRINPLRDSGLTNSEYHGRQCYCCDQARNQSPQSPSRFSPSRPQTSIGPKTLNSSSHQRKSPELDRKEAIFRRSPARASLARQSASKCKSQRPSQAKHHRGQTVVQIVQGMSIGEKKRQFNSSNHQTAVQVDQKIRFRPQHPKNEHKLSNHNRSMPRNKSPVIPRHNQHNTHPIIIRQNRVQQQVREVNRPSQAPIRSTSMDSVHTARKVTSNHMAPSTLNNTENSSPVVFKRRLQPQPQSIVNGFVSSSSASGIKRISHHRVQTTRVQLKENKQPKEVKTIETASKARFNSFHANKSPRQALNMPQIKQQEHIIKGQEVTMEARELEVTPIPLREAEQNTSKSIKQLDEQKTQRIHAKAQGQSDCIEPRQGSEQDRAGQPDSKGQKQQSSHLDAEFNNSLVDQNNNSSGQTTWKISEQIDPKKVSEPVVEDSVFTDEQPQDYSHQQNIVSPFEQEIKPTLKQEEQAVVLINPPTLLPQPKPLDFIEQVHSEAGHEESLPFPQSSDYQTESDFSSNQHILHVQQHSDGTIQTTIAHPPGLKHKISNSQIVSKTTKPTEKLTLQSKSSHVIQETEEQAQVNLQELQKSYQDNQNRQGLSSNIVKESTDLQCVENKKDKLMTIMELEDGQAPIYTQKTDLISMIEDSDYQKDEQNIQIWSKKNEQEIAVNEQGRQQSLQQEDEKQHNSHFKGQMQQQQSLVPVVVQPANTPHSQSKDVSLFLGRQSPSQPQTTSRQHLSTGRSSKLSQFSCGILPLTNLESKQIISHPQALTIRSEVLSVKLSASSTPAHSDTDFILQVDSGVMALPTCSIGDPSSASESQRPIPSVQQMLDQNLSQTTSAALLAFIPMSLQQNSLRQITPETDQQLEFKKKSNNEIKPSTENNFMALPAQSHQDCLSSYPIQKAVIRSQKEVEQNPSNDLEDKRGSINESKIEVQDESEEDSEEDIFLMGTQANKIIKVTNRSNLQATTHQQRENISESKDGAKVSERLIDQEKEQVSPSKERTYCQSSIGVDKVEQSDSIMKEDKIIVKEAPESNDQNTQTDELLFQTVHPEGEQTPKQQIEQVSVGVQTFKAEPMIRRVSKHNCQPQMIEIHSNQSSLQNSHIMINQSIPPAFTDIIEEAEASNFNLDSNEKRTTQQVSPDEREKTSVLAQSQCCQSRSSQVQQQTIRREGSVLQQQLKKDLPQIVDYIMYQPQQIKLVPQDEISQDIQDTVSVKFVRKHGQQLISKLFNQSKTKACLFIDNSWLLVSNLQESEIKLEQLIGLYGAQRDIYETVEMLTAWPIRLVRDPNCSTNSRLIKTLTTLLSKKQEEDSIIYSVSDGQRPLEVQRMRSFVDDKELPKPILECRYEEQTVHIEASKVNEFTRIPILNNPRFLLLQVQANEINTFELALDSGLIYLKGKYRFILYSQKQADKYELVCEGKHNVCYKNPHDQHRFLLIIQPIDQLEGEPRLTVRVETKSEEWRGKVVKVERGKRTEDEAGYENSKNIYVPVAREVSSDE